MRVLNLENNPFEKIPEFVKMITSNLPQCLEMYNNQKKVYYEYKLKNKKGLTQKDTIDVLAGVVDAQNSPHHEEQENEEEDEESKESNLTQIPTLKHLVYNLEAANNHPMRALKFLKQLFNDAERVKYVQKNRSSNVFIKSFTGNDDEQTIQDYIETFMQNAQLLIDN